MENKDLVNRLNRVVGQIEARKKNVDVRGNLEFSKTLVQLKASINALKKFGEAYVNDYVAFALAQNKDRTVLESEVKAAIEGAFSV